MIQRAGTWGIAAVLAVLCVLAPAAARADAGEWLAGGQAVGELPGAGGIDAVAQLGLGDVLALRATAGARRDAGSFAGDATVGFVWAWDVLAWVPEVFVGGGVRAGSSTAGEIALGLDLRRYVSLDWSVSIGVSGGYRTDGQRYGTLALGLWRRLP